MNAPITPPGAITVHPSRPGVFPPASFPVADDAWDYAFLMQAETLERDTPCGIHLQAAYSFRLKLEGKA